MLEAATNVNLKPKGEGETAIGGVKRDFSPTPSKSSEKERRREGGGTESAIGI